MRREDKRNETREDKLFRSRLEREFEEFGPPQGSLKTRSRHRDLEADQEAVEKRLRDKRHDKRRSIIRKQKREAEEAERKRQDRELGRQGVRDTHMRINLTKELIEKVPPRSSSTKRS